MKFEYKESIPENSKVLAMEILEKITPHGFQDGMLAIFYAMSFFMIKYGISEEAFNSQLEALKEDYAKNVESAKKHGVFNPMQARHTYDRKTND